MLESNHIPPMPEKPPTLARQRPVVTLRRWTAIAVAAGLLVVGGVAGAALNAIPWSQSYQSLDEAYQDRMQRIADLESVVTLSDSTIEALEQQVQELENAPELLAAQKEEREAEEAAIKKEAEDKAAAEKAEAEKKAADEKAAAEKKAKEDAAAKAEAERTFGGNGTYMVGEEVKPGRYRSDGGDLCYWARLSGTSGEFGDIITNHVTEGATTVTIAPSDVAFETSGCALWERQG